MAAVAAAAPAERFQAISAAYEVLGHAARREAYDAERAGGRSARGENTVTPDSDYGGGGGGDGRRGDGAWRQGWRRSREGERERVFVHSGTAGGADEDERAAMAKQCGERCAGRGVPRLDRRLRARPLKARNVAISAVGLGFVNVSFEAPPTTAGRLRPSVYFAVILPEGREGGDDAPPLCMSFGIPPPRDRKAMTARSTRAAAAGANKTQSASLTIHVGGLEQATLYAGFAVLSCSTVNVTSCKQMHASECAAPARAPEVRTLQPTVEGSINAGTHDGGGWVLVRRVGPGERWHPATDNLTGSAEYGEACGPTANCTFSQPFANVGWKEARGTRHTEPRGPFCQQPPASARTISNQQSALCQQLPCLSTHHLEPTLALCQQLPCLSCAIAPFQTVCSVRSRARAHVWQMLFATGDEKRWLQLERSWLWLHGKQRTADATPVRVSKSHLYTLEYPAQMMMRGTHHSDPLIRTDLRAPGPRDPLLYAEASKRATSDAELLESLGANVWVRPWVPPIERAAVFDRLMTGGRGRPAAHEHVLRRARAGSGPTDNDEGCDQETVPLPSSPLSTVLRSMRRCPQHGDIQLECVALIETAAAAAPAEDAVDPGRRQLVQEGVVELLLQLLQGEAASTPPRLVSRALKALLKLLRSPEAAARLMEGGRYQSVYYALQTHQTVDVQANGLAVLWAVGRKDQRYARELRGTGAAIVADTACAGFPREGSVRGWAGLLRETLQQSQALY